MQDLTFISSLSISFEAIGKLLLVALVGFLAVRKNFLNEAALNGLARLMIDVVVPAALCANMVKGFNREVLVEGSALILLPLIWITASIPLTLIYFKLFPGDGNWAADRATSVLASVQNSMYVPLPLGLAVAPPEFIPLVIVFVGMSVLVVNPLQWTVGTWLLMDQQKDRRDWKSSLKMALNGPVLGVIIGATLSLVPGLSEAARGEEGSLLGLRMIFGAMGFIGTAMAPMAMILTGALIARCELKTSLTVRRVSVVIVMRFLLIPLGIFLLLKGGYIPATGFVAVMLMIQACAPPAMNPAIVAKRYDGEWQVVSAILLVSNVVALLAMPVWMALGLRFM